ncbi:MULTISPECIES: nucleotidyltransferase family protein [Pseudomonas]|uniref:Nucleotidyltransferase family protein n=1 Tax=Pseudomonas quercus TaxID=2722792 RepID=A0ABX0YGW9_9PSED|nr:MULTISPECIES: nucleotidyltransferase family protein [Pseudomonas]MBF7144200.1 nucleotidyltransferase family protein [Pseudomonas sp. LY10J]NJP02668.1 nucleotidyltransferase family protein [Pseudomonas quercus]
MNHLCQLQAMIGADPVRLEALRIVSTIGLPDCWIAAGFVRSAIWDRQHNRTYSPLPSDIDVVWFDKTRTDSAIDVEIENQLLSLAPSLNWSVKNQARMHVRNHDMPYSSVAHAMTGWCETATGVAVRLGVDDVIEVSAPFGLDDLFNLVVRPTARFQLEKKPIYLERVRSKNWLATWPSLKILDY